MPQVVQITSGNFDGQTAFVTFYPCSGGTPIVIGNVIIPYNYNSDYFLGTYTLYFLATALAVITDGFCFHHPQNRSLPDALTSRTTTLATRF